MTIVKATKESSLKDLKLKELLRCAQEGELFEVSEDRAKYLAGDNPLKVIVAVPANKEEIAHYNEMHGIVTEVDMDAPKEAEEMLTKDEAKEELPQETAKELAGAPSEKPKRKKSTKKVEK